ncbi:MAG: hypothetical protein JW395_3541 [Nitrospira sp.]|nr:hypothetical protein [Nitrospira sp.]
MADRIGVDDDADTGDQHHHDRAQAVDKETHRKSQGGERSRVVETNDDRPLRRHKPQGRNGAEKGNADGKGGDLGS